jgi:nitrogen-specific signal transduction histidine kinase/DNA-binding NarL/FixJ family response regulator
MMVGAFDRLDALAQGKGDRDDVAALVELRAALAASDKARQAGEAANEAKTRFLASVSHEIRSPLNAIYGYAQLLERKGSVDPAHAARVIRRSAEHLSHLVEGLLDISQVEGGSMRLSRDVVRFPEFLDQVIDMLGLQARAKGIALVLERPANGLPDFVHADQKRLRQVLINLLSNAIKFTDQGQVTLKIAYRNDMATFDVIDTGIGIAPADLQRIFAPFERVAGPAAERAGAGLGLAITQALVRIMGGDIQVESTPSAGSRFTVRLLLSRPALSPSMPTPAAGAITGYLGRERQVLLIDDDAAHLAMVRGLLEPLGFLVHTAPDGQKGLALAGQVQPDLVLLDVALANESGWEIAERLRHRHGEALQIVMLSGETPASGKAGDNRPFGEVFVMKPFDFNVLLDLIARQMGIEWVRVPGITTDPVTNAGQPDALPTGATRHLAEIGRLCRIGQVRGIETEIEALAAYGHAAATLAERLRVCLDCFDLGALAAIAREAQAHAQ